MLASARFANAGAAPGDLNVKDYGVVGDGITDDTAAIQALFNAAPDYATIYFPTSPYLLTATLDFGAKTLHLRGDSPGLAASGVTSGGSVLFGTVHGPLIRTGTVLHTGLIIERLGLKNLHTVGTGVMVTGVGIVLRDLGISAFVGIDARFNTFTLAIENCVIRCPGAMAWALGSIGILASSHTDIRAADIQNYDHGIRAYGPTVNIIGCRLEVNRVAMMLGMDPAGGAHNLSSSIISGNTMEANDVGIQVKAIASSFLSAMVITGTTNSPSHQPQMGLYVESGSWTEYNSITVSGAYSKAAIRVKTGTHLFRNISASNTFPGAQLWDVQSNLVNVRFENTNYTQRPDDSMASSLIDYQRSVRTYALSQIDNLNPAVEGRNLRGKNVPVPPAATSVAVTFTGLHTESAGIKTIAAAPGGRLAPGTYYYTITTVTPHGETGAMPARSIAVDAVNNKVSIATYRQPQDGIKLRVYRGTLSGTYDGYFETRLNPGSSWSDDGTLVFSGRKSPPIQGLDAETDMREPDANYAVIVTTSWNTTSWVTAKATTGFTIRFGTPPTVGGTVDWLIVR